MPDFDRHTESSSLGQQDMAHFGCPNTLQQSYIALYSASRMYWQAESFLQLLNTRPEYRKHVRHLSVFFDDPEPVSLFTLLRMLERCKMINVLTLMGDLDFEYCDTVLAYIKRLELHQLNLKYDCAWDFLPLMLWDPQLLSLRILTVEDCVNLLEIELPPFSTHANIEQLSIHADCWFTKSVDTLVRWPARLKALSLSLVPPEFQPPVDHGGGGMTGIIQSLLEIHQDSLEIIELVSPPGEVTNQNSLNFSAYTKLRSLRLHEHHILNTSPQNVSSQLPPGLQELKLDVASNLQPWDVCPLDRNDVKWLKEFFALRKKTIPDHELKSVLIGFTFDDSAITHCPLTGYIEHGEWPCETLDNAAHVLQPLGLSLTYPKPYISKAAWSTMIRDQTVPGWEYYTTKKERMAVSPAEVEEYEHFELGDYIHDGANCQRIDPLPDETIEPTELTESDGRDCVKICSYLKATCTQERPVCGITRVPETDVAATIRRKKNYARGFTVCHDNLRPECAKTIAQEQRWWEMCERS